MREALNVIRILHLKTSSSVGGAETMLCFWPKLLNRSKFGQVFIFGEDGPLVTHIRQLGEETIVLNKLGSMYGFIYLIWLVLFVNKEKIDIIHAHGARVNLWGVMVAYLANIPIISTEHNVDLWREKSFVLNFIDKIIGKFNAKRGGVSQAVCDMLIDSGLNPDRILCINNGIDVSKFTVNEGKLLHLKGVSVSNDDVILGAIGRMVEQKGFKYLLTAFKLLVEDAPDCKLIFIGNGPQLNELKQQSHNLGLDNKVSFLGERNDIPDCLACIDIFVLPSITEGLPLVLLEAMASKKPVVASSVSGVPYVVDDNVEGILVPPKDPRKIKEGLKRLVDNPDLRNSMGVKAFTKVCNQFRAGNMIKQYEQVYTDIVGVNFEK